MWAVITYGMPSVSARMVPMLLEFCKKYLEKD